MLYLYDNAIVNDLKESFNTENDSIDDPVVKVISPDKIIDIAAQVKEDNLTFPIIALERNEPIEIDDELSNFTKKQVGVPTVFDTDSNDIYKEKAIHVNLSYTLSVLTTNQIDMDEIIRELIFKYNSMYFLDIHIPYEGNRDISFGIEIDSSHGISKQSGISEYTESGKLYQSSIMLRCEGCVLLHYTKSHLTRNVLAIDVR